MFRAPLPGQIAEERGRDVASREITDKQRGWLTGELTCWNALGLLSSDQAARILELYGTPEDAAERRGAARCSRLPGLAALLVGLAPCSSLATIGKRCPRRSSWPCSSLYCWPPMCSLLLGLPYVWGGGPLRGRDACGDLAYFPRFFERPPMFFPENRSDNISLRLAGIIGICP